MKTLRSQVGAELLWRRRESAPDSLVLGSESEVFATLKRERGSLYTGQVAEGEWTFKRAGFLRPRVTIRARNSADDLGSFWMSWTGGGFLRLPHTTRYHWAQVNFWNQEYAFRDEGGRDILMTRAKPGGELLVALEPAAEAVPELGLLTLLAAYLTVLIAEDVAVSTAATVAATSAV